MSNNGINGKEGNTELSENKLFNVFGQTESIPSQQTLVSLKLLKEANRPMFEHLMRHEARFLTTAVQAVSNNEFLKMKLGGDVLTASVNLSRLLRSRAEKKVFDEQMDPIVQNLISAEKLSAPTLLTPTDSKFMPAQDHLKAMRTTSSNVFKSMLSG